MSLIYEDGVLINGIDQDVLWDGLFSKCVKNGSIIKYVESLLPKNSIFIIPISDGDICRNNVDKKWSNDTKFNWDSHVQPYLDYAIKKNKIFIIGTLSQITLEKDVNYIYLPLDDHFFTNGVISTFSKIPWHNKSDKLCWRGGCSGNGLDTVRIRFTKKIYDYNPKEDVRLSWWWSENKNIPQHYLSERLHYTDFLKYKIFFIVDGNVIASNHMWGFATGSVPFYISNATCWFSSLIVPYVHYIPVNYDLSNLIEQVEWVKNNDEQAKNIADNAYHFAEIFFSSDYQKNYLNNEFNKFK